jgi:hypothetical protein
VLDFRTITAGGRAVEGECLRVEEEGLVFVIEGAVSSRAGSEVGNSAGATITTIFHQKLIPSSSQYLSVVFFGVLQCRVTTKNRGSILDLFAL